MPYDLRGQMRIYLTRLADSGLSNPYLESKAQSYFYATAPTKENASFCYLLQTFISWNIDYSRFLGRAFHL